MHGGSLTTYCSLPPAAGALTTPSAELETFDATSEAETRQEEP